MGYTESWRSLAMGTWTDQTVGQPVTNASQPHEVEGSKDSPHFLRVGLGDDPSRLRSVLPVTLLVGLHDGGPVKHFGVTESAFIRRVEPIEKIRRRDGCRDLFPCHSVTLGLQDCEARPRGEIGGRYVGSHKHASVHRRPGEVTAADEIRALGRWP